MVRCWGFLQTFSQIALKEHPEQKNRKEERKPQFSVDFASAARGASLAKRSEATASAARSCPGERCASGPRPPHPGPASDHGTARGLVCTTAPTLAPSPGKSCSPQGQELLLGQPFETSQLCFWVSRLPLVSTADVIFKFGLLYLLKFKT